MKKFLAAVAVTLCVILSSNYSFAQQFIGFVSAGANFAQIEGDDVHGFTKIGANAGPGVMLPLNHKKTWSLSVELLYVQKGSLKRCPAGYFDTTNYAPVMFEDVDRNIPFNSNLKCKMALDYVQIPLMVHYEDMMTGCTFGLGFSWSRLVRAKEVFNGFTRTTNVRSHTFNTSDWSVLADVDIRLYKNLSLDIRYEYSMAPIRKMDFVYMRNDGSVTPEVHKLRNHLLSLRLTYYFNKKYRLNTKVNKHGDLIGTKWVRDIDIY